MQAGVGLGWVTKIYDVRTNYKNVAIGSHLNCAIQLRFNNELHISKNDNVNFSVGQCIGQMVVIAHQILE